MSSRCWINERRITGSRELTDMGRIEELFAKKNKRIVNVYCTAGYPKLDSTLEVIKALQKAGADMIELGMPYSDPLADGPTIQQSGSLALTNGMTIRVLFEQLKDFRKEIQLPVLLMGYMNPVLQFGFEDFCLQAASLGIDGLILPDLPIYEFETQYGKIIQKTGIDFVFLVTPETTEERIRKLDELSRGFLYAVSSSSTTGGKKGLADQTGYFMKLRDMELKNPFLIGFGIGDKRSFQTACEYANGAVIGSAYIQAIEKSDDLELTTKNFLNSIR
jgi:tryptophan synthase alpha chain